MSLTDTETTWLEHNESTYRFGGDISNLWLTSVIGPSLCGKSTVISDALKIAASLGLTGPDNLLAEVDTIATRGRRDDDPAGYRTANEGITHQWMMNEIQQQKLVQWTLFETGHLYATDRQSYKGRFNLLPTQEKALPMFNRAGFGQLHMVCLVRPVQEWSNCFPRIITTRNHLARLEESKKSLDFGMTQTGAIRLINYSDPERRHATATSLVKIATTRAEEYNPDMIDPFHKQEYERHNRAMYAKAQELIDSAQITS